MPGLGRACPVKRIGDSPHDDHQGRTGSLHLTEGWIKIDTHRAGIKTVHFAQNSLVRGTTLGEEIITTVTDHWELVRIARD